MNVQDNQVGTNLARLLHGLPAVAGLENLITGVFQNRPDQLPPGLPIVRHQHFFHGRCAFRPGSVTGSVTKNVLPFPGRLSTRMVPPCCSTRRFVMAKPNPVPSRTPRVVAPT